MDARKRWLPISGIAILVVVRVGMLAWQVGWLHSWGLAAPFQWSSSRSSFASAPARWAQPFTPAEIAAFLAHAKQARAMADPLQRCLAYPDPPGSHWSRDAVAAYCRYTTQSAISAAELSSLVQNDHAAQVDQRMADALQAQRTQPDARGLLDRTYNNDFRDASPEMRGILDAWKRQSPASGFAYAASGVAYVFAAREMRGTQTVRQTASAQFAAMRNLLQLADGDFSKALALNPQLTPVYASMVESGTYGSRPYGMAAAEKGLAIDPANFAIYVRLMQLSEPKWGGSIGGMQQLAVQAQTHASGNPLLSLLATDAPAYLASGGDCDCLNMHYVPDYRRVFDKAAGFRPLATAGSIAYDNELPGAGLGLVYSAEAVRFAPVDSDSSWTLSYELTRYGELQWAREEGNFAVAQSPFSAISYDARGFAYDHLQDYAHALSDYGKAVELDPSDQWPLVQMGSINVHKTHDWDTAWAEANQLIKLFPDNPEGWILRLSIEKDQPRAGFHDDGIFFLAHFSQDPNQQAAVREVRQWVAEGKYR